MRAIASISPKGGLCQGRGKNCIARLCLFTPGTGDVS